MKKIVFIFSAFILSACSSYMPQRYSVSADNVAALKGVGASNINVAPFRLDVADFDNTCRVKHHILLPGDVSFESYIQKAFSDELKVAGVFDDKTPVITLSGVVETLSFSSVPSDSMTMQSMKSALKGSWDIGLRIKSSNGKSSVVSEHYEFTSGLLSDEACRQTADAFFPAVQDLIGKLVSSAKFKSLVTP